MNRQATYWIILILILLLQTQAYSDSSSAMRAKISDRHLVEFRNQFYGGLLGSAIGAGAGFGLGMLQGGDLESDRRVPAYMMFGNVVGNSIGHWIACNKNEGGALITSLGAGIAITTLMTKDPAYLNKTYYNTSFINQTDWLFWSSLFMIQPIVTSITHILWPHTPVSLLLNVDKGKILGIRTSLSF